MNSDLVLIRIDAAKAALLEAKTIQEAKQISDVAEAARIYALRSKLSTETVNYAMEIRLRAERLLGEMLAAAKAAGQLIQGKNTRHHVDGDDMITLREVGITRDESSRAQKLATIPDAQWEKTIESKKTDGIVSISAILTDLNKHPQKPEHRSDEKKPDKVQRFNQVNENIGWARWSWNPVTGCLHNCDYCYARDIANRFYEQKFEPTFFPERLEAPANTKIPGEADPNDPSWRRVFTCSMADLFGKWVPQKWIKPIFNQIEQHQEWEFLCLTKFPQRLAELEWPANVWAGTTVDRQHRVATAEKSFSGVKAGVKWLSCEPLLEPLKFTSLAMFDWVVIGASTGSTLVAPFAPPFEWVADLYAQAKASGCKVYLKHNLFGAEDGRTPGMQPIHEWPR